MAKSERITEKQEFELNVATLFQEAGGLSSDYKLAPVKCDPPDVLAEKTGSKIGIEIRRLYAVEKRKGGSPQRKYLSACKKVVEEAAKQHRTKSNQWYNVDVYFNPNCKIGNNRVQALATELVNLVTSMALQHGQSIDRLSEHFLGEGWPKEVHEIFVGLFEGTNAPFWSPIYTLWWGKTDFNLIQKGLDEKEERYSKFKDEVDDAWLLLAFDGSVGDSLLAFHSEIKTEIYRSSFDRAFVLGPTGKDFVELNVQRD